MRSAVRRIFAVGYWMTAVKEELTSRGVRRGSEWMQIGEVVLWVSITVDGVEMGWGRESQG